MSRTKRRKGAIPPEGWSAWKFANLNSIDYDDIDVESVKYKKYADWQYHKDTRNGFGWKGNVPSGIRKSVIRHYRTKAKHEVIKINKKGIYEEYSFDPWKVDFGWHYW